MRWSAIAACFFGLALAGCYNPKVQNAGFACSPTDNPPCPSGFVCVQGYCVDNPNGVPMQDLAVGTGGNGGEGGGGGGGGGGTMSTDMTMTTAGGDMAMPAGDMAKPPTCAMQGSPCNGNGDCCSGTCFDPFGDPGVCF